MQFLVFILTYPLLLLISLLPFPLFYAFSDGLSFLLGRVVGYRKKMIRQNIRLVFPDYSEAEVERVTRKFYRHMCDLFLEIIKGITLSNRTILKRFVPTNLEVLTAFEKQNRSTIIICGHYSSWEWMLSLGLRLANTPYGIYTPLSNPYFDRMIRKIRKKYRADLISRYETISTIEKHQEDGVFGHYGFASDQSPFPKPKSYWRPFLGVNVPVFTGAERLAIAYNIPVVFADIQRVKRGHYEVTFKVISDQSKDTQVHEITDTFIGLLEQQIYQDPGQYLWSHNRFKYRHLSPTANG